MNNFHPIHYKPPTRRTDIKQKAKYTSYKIELRTDFSKKCGYCGTADYYSGGQRGFHIDHFAPKVKFVHLTHEYTNLVYCCPICNLGKSDDWPGDDPQISYVGNVGYVDPCLPTYTNHLMRNQAGQIVALTELGEYIHKKLKLNLKRRQICWLIDKMESQMQTLREMIANDEHNLELLIAFHSIGNQYLEHIGILKSE